MAYFNNVNVIPDGPFGRSSYVHPKILFDYKGGSYLTEEILSKRTLGTNATVTMNQAYNSIDLTVNRGNSGEAIIQSYEAFEYQGSKGQEVWFTAVFGDTSGGVIQEIAYGGGWGDANVGQGNADGLGSIMADGIALRSQNNVMSVSLWTSTSGVPVRSVSVTRASWDDPLDGTGPSGVTIDFTKGVIFKIRLQYLGYGDINFYIATGDPDHPIVKFHTIVNNNTNTFPYMRRGTLPVRARAYSPGGSSGTTTLRVTCMAVDSLGGGTVTGSLVTFARDAADVYVTPNNLNVWNLLYAARLATGYNYANITLDSCTVAAPANGDFSVILGYNFPLTPTLSGVTWTPLSAGISNCPLEIYYPLTGTNFAATLSKTNSRLQTNGIIWMGSATDQQSILHPEIKNRDITIGRQLDGTSPIMMACVANIEAGRAEDYTFALNCYLSTSGS
jgi:hypothetical protein